MLHFRVRMQSGLFAPLSLALSLTCLCCAAHDSRAQDTASTLANYNVVWDSPSADAHGSMPIGNGDVGISAWVEPSGDLVFYVSKTDAWDENGRLCKIGRVRVKFDPPLPVANGFRQELKLREGVIAITAGKSQLDLWVDANQPVVRLEATSDAPVRCRAEIELWRLRERPYGKDDDSHSGGGLSGQAFEPTVLPDVVFESTAPRVVWYHRDTRSVYPPCLKVQHLETLQNRFPDPLLDLTFGACLSGTGCARSGERAIQSSVPARQHELSVTILTAKTETPEAWLEQLDRLEKRGRVPDRQAHEAWWRAFWERSWVFVEGGPSLALPVNAHLWRVGVASDGSSRFRGTLVEPRVIGRALSAEEIAELARKDRSEERELRPEELAGGCTVAAWIKPAAGEAGRILDKCTAGRPEGFTFDAHPGLSLRWIVGEHTMIHEGCLKPDEWQHRTTSSPMRRSFPRRCTGGGFRTTAITAGTTRLPSRPIPTSAAIGAAAWN